ncbi:MAG: hypothetical protein IKB53_05380 [Oscillospiraceae bacterium]|nr:hypothetical protein [Oscillospiraceae bacterium]
MKKKEPKEKKEKKIKAKKGKKDAAVGKKKLSKKKLIILLVLILAIAAAAFFFLRGRGGDAEGEEPPQEEEVVKEDPVVSAPTAYTVDEGLEVMALPVGRDVVVKAHTPTVEELTALAKELAAAEAEAEAETTVEQLGAEMEGGEDAAEGEEGESPEDAEEAPAEEEELVLPPAYTTYIYSGEGADVARLQLYCDLLTAEDFGFIPVDEEMVETKMPKFTDPSGSLHLVRAVQGKDYVEEVNLAEKGEEKHMELVPVEEKELEGEFLLSLRIDWDEEALRITPAMIEGAIVIPPPPEPMTLVEAVDHMYSLPPEVLGLEGESMEPYMVFPIDGSVMVEGVPAMRMYIYSKSESGTNVFEGQYLLSNGGHRIFSVQDNGSLLEIEY